MNLHDAVENRINGLRTKFGRSGSVSPEIPTAFLMKEVLDRVVELTRGLVRFQAMAFVGRGVRVRDRGSFQLARYARLGDRCEIDALGSRGVRLGVASGLGRGSVVTTTSHMSRLGVGFELGAGSSFGDYCHFGASGGVVIGQNVVGGSFVSFHSQNHVFTSNLQLIREQGTTEKGIYVGSNCWIGAKATFLDGSKICSGSVVAAGAVVMGIFDRPALLGGVPAKVIRFLDE